MNWKIDSRRCIEMKAGARIYIIVNISSNIVFSITFVSPRSDQSLSDKLAPRLPFVLTCHRSCWSNFLFTCCSRAILYYWHYFWLSTCFNYWVNTAIFPSLWFCSLPTTTTRIRVPEIPDKLHMQHAYNFTHLHNTALFHHPLLRNHLHHRRTNRHIPHHRLHAPPPLQSQPSC